MNLQHLMQMANKFGIGNDKISEAQRLMTRYSNDINGLRQAINEHGGMDFFDKVLKAYNNPLVKGVLSKAGITDEVINGIKKDLGMVNKNQDDVLERLKRLK